jgi:hypothetical protein
MGTLIDGQTDVCIHIHTDRQAGRLAKDGHRYKQTDKKADLLTACSPDWLTNLTDLTD